MIEVQDLPQSDDGEDVEEEEEGEEVDPAVDVEASEPFDEEAFQKQISDRLEAVRLNKALGNDNPSDIPSHSESEEELDYSDSDDSVLSDAPPQSDFTTYVRTPAPRPLRINARKLGGGNELRETIARQVIKEREDKERKHHSRKGAKVGNAKGHKWKANANFLVGKGGGDGW
jgi:RIO kinase 2